MKKLFKALSVLLVLLVSSVCLAGCVRFHTTLNVKSNGRVDAKIMLATIDVSDYGTNSTDVSEEAKQQFIDEGWEIEDYDKDGFVGFVATKNDIRAEDLQSNMKMTQSDLGNSGNISFKKDGKNYIFDWKVFNDADSEQMKAAKSYFRLTGGYMKLTITLPSAPVDSNATKVSNGGKTLEWDLLNLDEDQNVHVEFALTSVGWGKTLGIIGILLLVVILIVVLVLVLRDRKKHSAQTAAVGIPQNGGYQTPNASGGFPQGNGGYQTPNAPGSFPQGNGGYQTPNASGSFPQSNGYQTPNAPGGFSQNGSYQTPNAPGGFPQDAGYQNQNPAGSYQPGAVNQTPGMSENYGQLQGGFNYAQNPQQAPDDNSRFQPKPPADADNE